MQTTIIQDQKIQHVVNDLAHQGWNITPNFFSHDLTQTLYNEVMQHAAAEQLHKAAIGHGEQQMVRLDIRGDKTLWLNGSSPAQLEFLATMEGLRQQINRELFLGLHDQEAHFALYEPGTGYDMHMDSFQQNNRRRITTVSYLNPNWEIQDGGELILCDAQYQPLQRILPQAGTLVRFASERFPHQVAITHKQRSSIAGWFRVRDDNPLLNLSH